MFLSIYLSIYLSICLSVCLSIYLSLRSIAPTLAGVVLGLLWTLNAVSGLTIATPACLYLGFKKSMLLSLTGYAFQVSALFLAVIIPHEPSKWAIAVLGSLVAGITSAIWWTAQGIYFEYVSQEIALRLVVDENDYSSDTVNNNNNNNNNEGVLPIDQIRADLSADWTIIYQGADVAVFLCISLLTLSSSISIVSVIGGLSVVGGVTAALGTTFDSIESDDAVEISIADIQRAVMAVPRQYRNDCRATLLAPFVFGFGISTAMFASYVNSEIISHYLGTDSLGYLEAFSYLIAIIVAYPYAYIANNIDNGRDLVIQFGSTAFLLTGLFVLVLNPDTLGTYGVMFLLKGLYGLGRGVFEGSCRAVYASMFTGEDLSTAFSGQTLAAGFSGGLCFFIFIYLMRTTIGIIVVVNGVLAVLSYFIIMNMTERNSIMSWSVLLGLSIIIPPSSTDGKGDDVANVIHTRDVEIPPIRVV